MASDQESLRKLAYLSYADEHTITTALITLVSNHPCIFNKKLNEHKNDVQDLFQEFVGVLFESTGITVHDGKLYLCLFFSLILTMSKIIINNFCILL